MNNLLGQLKAIALSGFCSTEPSGVEVLNKTWIAAMTDVTLGPPDRPYCPQ